MKDLLKYKGKNRINNKTKAFFIRLIENLIFNKFFNHLFTREENLNLYNVISQKIKPEYKTNCYLKIN